MRYPCTITESFGIQPTAVPGLRPSIASEDMMRHPKGAMDGRATEHLTRRKPATRQIRATTE